MRFPGLRRPARRVAGSTVPAHQQRLAQQVVAVAMQHGIPVQEARVMDGPLALRVHLVAPVSVETLRIARQIVPVLRASLGRGVSLDDGAGLVYVVNHPSLRTPAASALMRWSRGPNVVLGLDEVGGPVVINLEANPTVIWVGPTYSGKTQSMLSTVAQAVAGAPPDRVQLVICTMKPWDWEPLHGTPHLHRMETQPGAILEALAWAKRVMERRAGETRNRYPAILLVVDDVLNIAQAEPGVSGPMQAIASMGRAGRVFLLVGTQMAGNRMATGGVAVNENATARIVYRPAGAQQGARNIGFGGVDLRALSGQAGDAWAVTPQGVVRCATAYMDEDMENLLKGRRGPAGEYFPPDELALAQVAVQAVAEERQEAALAEERRERGGLDVVREARIVRMLEAGASLNAIAREVFGHKNDRVIRAIKEVRARWEAARGEGEPDPEPVSELDDDRPGFVVGPDGVEALDLSTEEGRALFEEMVRRGEVRLPVDQWKDLEE